MWCHIPLDPRLVFLKSFEKSVKMGGDYLSQALEELECREEDHGKLSPSHMERGFQASHVTSSGRMTVKKSWTQWFCIFNPLGVLMMGKWPKISQLLLKISYILVLYNGEMKKAKMKPYSRCTSIPSRCCHACRWKMWGTMKMCYQRLNSCLWSQEYGITRGVLHYILV